MTIAELKELLPFYVAGTLEPRELKSIEEALKTSEELRKDLQFWQSAQAAVLLHSERAAAGHVGPEQIVGLAEGTIPREQRQVVEAHLRSCGPCTQEYNLVKASLATRESGSPSFTRKLLHIVRPIRLVYAAPVLAAMIVATLLYLGRSRQDATTPVSPQVRVPPRGDQRTSLWLTYEPDLRSTSRRSIPRLKVNEQDRIADVFIAIPHSAVSGIRYHVSIGTGQALFDSLRRYASGATHDSIHVVLYRTLIPRPGDTLNIGIQEILPAGIKGLTPEEYHFSVLIEQGGSL